MQLLSQRTCCSSILNRLLHTFLLAAFVRAGGLNVSCEVCREFINGIETISQVPADQRPDTMEQELTQAYGNRKVTLSCYSS